jgi:hypothetical protein
MKLSTYLIPIILVIFCSCSEKSRIEISFDEVNDRTWIGQDFWAIPLEDWQVKDGRVECRSNIPKARVHLLTQVLSPENGEFQISARMGLLENKKDLGTAGFLIGVYDKDDPDIKAACYYGKGIKAGISLSGRAFIGDESTPLPPGFNFENFSIKVSGSNHSLTMVVSDSGGLKVKIADRSIEGIQGIIAMGTNLASEEDGKLGKSGFWFDDLALSGTKVVEKPENSFGPILWTTYTLSRNRVKLMVQMPPIGASDNQEITLQLKSKGDWESINSEVIEPDSRTAVFRMENWDDTVDRPFRILYSEETKTGKTTDHYFQGMIRKDPVDRPLRVAGLTCQNHNGYPYSPVVKNLEKADPDFLYFSGDQIYEGNGGYGIKRTPAEASILSYLGKYYMFGWAFGNIMRDRPTVCTPDDHDVFHGNLWGDSGKLKEKASDDQSGFVQSVRMVNAVNRTQCGNLPDPWDPSPIRNGMSVWYTDLVYGRVSFAIISDRVYKSGPENVAVWSGRQDHVKHPLKDPSILHKPGLQLAGERQEEFLRNWVENWEGADMKVLLSQTVFANVATHHGGLMEYVHGDLDSGGWPKKKRDELVGIIRKCFAFNINGDQHVPSLVQYGIDDYRDAGWSFCTPAIAVGYSRAFLPDELGWKVRNRPEHGLPNTGEYEDAFGNKSYVYAIGIPDKQLKWENRYYQAHMRSSGFGMITFDTKTRDIKLDCYRFLADLDVPNKDFQFPGWPLTINQMDNYSSGRALSLPTIKVNVPNQVVKVLDSRGELVYNIRMVGNTFTPKVFRGGSYSLRIGEGNKIKEIKNVRTDMTEPLSVEID